MTTTQPAALPEFVTAIDYADNPSDTTTSRIDVRVPIGARLVLQPQPAAAVSDERQLLREIVENHAESLQALGDELRQRGVTQISYYGPQAEVVAKAMQLIDRARALLALRPQAVPMTPEQVRALVVECGYDHASTQERADFINGVRTGERWHRITAQGAQGEQG